MSMKGVWVEAFIHFYPMTFAMGIGCLIAGSTPLGGAVVAFPVSVLVLKFSPEEGRDFGALIQSVGMVSAAYLIAVRKSHMVHTQTLFLSTFANTFGILLGFQLDIPGFWVNMIYTTFSVVTAALLFYKHVIKMFPPMSDLEEQEIAAAAHSDSDAISMGKSPRAEEVAKALEIGMQYCTHLTGAVAETSMPSKLAATKNSHTEVELTMKVKLILDLTLLACGIVGGILTSKIGFGADTMTYMFGVFMYNSFAPSPVPESTFAITSVVIMAFCSVVMAVILQVQGEISKDTYLCWGAALWIVVLGAPIGSWVLTEERETIFRRLFYVLAVLQFASFAILKIKARWDAWLFIGATMLVSTIGTTVHFFTTIGLCGLRRGMGGRRMNQT